MSVISKSLLLAGIVFSVSITVNAQKNWEEITTVEDLCENYPETMEEMFDQFNLDYQGLGEVKTAVNEDNIVDACKNSAPAGEEAGDQVGAGNFMSVTSSLARL